MTTARQQRTKTKPPLITLNIVLLLLSLGAAFLLAEMVMRIYGESHGIDYTLYMKELTNSVRFPDGLFIQDDAPYPRLRPNAQGLATTSDFSVMYNINSKGLRDKEYDYKPNGKTRMLAFGDSFTFGEGVDYGKRFTDIPESDNTHLEIINFGVPGYGLDQELILFAREGLKYSPDYVIIFINKVDAIRYSTNIIQNDSVVMNNATFGNPRNDSSTLFLSRDDPLLRQKENVILRNSYLLSYLNYHLHLLLIKKRMERTDALFWNNALNSSQGGRGWNNNEVAQRRTALILQKFYEIAQNEGIRFIIIKIDSSDMKLNFSGDMGNEVSYYDLSQDLRKESKKYTLSFTYDQHFNQKTHRFIGKKLIEILSNITSTGPDPEKRENI